MGMGIVHSLPTKSGGKVPSQMTPLVQNLERKCLGVRGTSTFTRGEAPVFRSYLGSVVRVSDLALAANGDTGEPLQN